ncbi:pyrroline-5-carboxylate reductase [Rhodocaloribacter litoris]|uniref:pyrroline-5-carboxylate reductase n=1 Tax=Rhodocaloribacter litoris TaxID=2558931 RepID=UPI001421FADF|nr:pyrroline-5-carboxylate reductase [Rhodocaloribacter litoris]QXD14963.1 pyrroline-5-carboxylate reductase [Rhodocaloribacter litoris]GIV58935.1 MAG: pyrroline-5-carboxylate reductase [Rhodothermaceae bacterium]
MLTNQTIAILGAGNIGRALIGGMLKSHELNPDQIRATRRNPAMLAALQEQFPGIRTMTDNTAAVQDASVVVLAIKPQNAFEVIREIRQHLPEEVLVISVLAGLTTQVLREAFAREIAVVRAMPNTPMIVDEGATAIAAGALARESHMTIARQLFEGVGMVEVVPEYLMDAVTGLSGSGPAYVYMFIEALTDGGVKQGLPRPQAFRLAAQTVYGAAKLVLESGKHPAILRDEVTTPGGTAIAAVADLEAHGLRTMLINAVATATARSKELSLLKD